MLSSEISGSIAGNNHRNIVQRPKVAKRVTTVPLRGTPAPKVSTVHSTVNVRDLPLAWSRNVREALSSDIKGNRRLHKVIVPY
jgi:hypothetical protein